MSAEQSGANDKPGNETPPRPEDIETPFFNRPTGPDSSMAGAVIGPYHLLQPIGQGGMGEVWLAEQKQPVRRRVAIKLIKAGMDTREVVARFESERQALALMDHPAIAKVFDAGSTPQGRPYFVMEYVTGIPITDVLRQAQADHAPAAGAVRPRLRRRAACAPESHPASRSEAFQHPGGRGGREAGAADYRFRRGESDLAAADARHHVHAGGGDCGDAGLHEPGASRLGRRGRGHAHGCVLAGRGAV